MGIRATLQNYVSKFLAPVDNRGGWFPLVRDYYSGSWQNGEKIKPDSVANNPTVYSCISLIASDIAKMPLNQKKKDRNGIWIDHNNQVLKRLLKNPNPYQNHIQFVEWWIVSKLFRGNVYGLKIRDRNREVVSIYILDPDRVEPLVTETGQVYYQLQPDNMSGLVESIIVSADEIIHDRMCCMFHPLVGVSPLFASALAASQGLKIQNDTHKFFSNSGRPGGVLTAPGSISNETAKRLSDTFQEKYSGDNAGRIAVLGDGLKFEALKMTAVESQLIEQLRWTDESICSTFHVPLYKVQKGAIPTSNNVEALTVDYFSQALQPLVYSMETCMTLGLELDEDIRIEFDLNALLRMDSSSLVKKLSDGVKGSLMTTNEGREQLNLPPVEGGDVVYSQQQYFSLAALAARDATNPLAAQEPSVGTPNPDESQNQNEDDESDDESDDMGDSEAAKNILIAMVTKGLHDVINPGN